jgi:hypothetical protein
MSLTQGSPGHAAQGGVTLGPGQGELGANFCHLGDFPNFYVGILVPRDAFTL